MMLFHELDTVLTLPQKYDIRWILLDIGYSVYN